MTAAQLYEVTAYATTRDTRWNTDHADVLSSQIVEAGPVAWHAPNPQPPANLLEWARIYVAADQLAARPDVEAVTVEVCAYWPPRIEHKHGGRSAHTVHLDAMVAATVALLARLTASHEEPDQ